MDSLGSSSTCLWRASSSSPRPSLQSPPWSALPLTGQHWPCCLHRLAGDHTHGKKSLLVPKAAPGGPRDLGPGSCSGGGLPRPHQARLHPLQLLRGHLVGGNGLSFTLQMTHLEGSSRRQNSICAGLSLQRPWSWHWKKICLHALRHVLRLLCVWLLLPFTMMHEINKLVWFQRSPHVEANNKCRLHFPEFGKTQVLQGL